MRFLWKLFDWKEGSPGHTFIQLRKKVGNKEISQNFGFYPVTGWKAVTANTPVNGKFVNNEYHEFNASVKINLTTGQLAAAITRMKALKNVKYDIDDYNCTGKSR